MTAGFNTQEAALERMSCIELTKFIRLQSEIFEAKRGGFSHWASALRSQLDQLIASKTTSCPAIISVTVKID